MSPPAIHLACPNCFQTTRFTRTRGSRSLGCLAYALAIPVLSLFVGMGVLALAFGGVQALGGSENLAAILASAFGLLAAASIVAWGIRSYRREVSAEVVVELDRIVITRGKRSTTLAFVDVDRVRLREQIYHDPAFEAVTRDGRRVVVPSDVAPVEASMKPLLVTLVASVAHSIESRLIAGEDVVVRQSAGRTALLLFQASMAYLMALGRVLNVPVAIRQVLHANRLVRLAVRGGSGGIRLTRDEVRGAGWHAQALAWKSATVSKDEDGLILEDRSRRLKLPASVDNYLPVLMVIENRIGR